MDPDVNMRIDATPICGTPREYILVSDTTSKVIKSSEDLKELRSLLAVIRSAGGQATIFKALLY